MSPYILFDRQQIERTNRLCGLVIEAQESYRKALLERGDGEVAKDLPTRETIEQIINESYPIRSKYDHSITIISSYKGLIGQFEERETVSKISEEDNLSKAMIREHLRLYGLIPQKWPTGGRRETDRLFDTFYNREQIIVIISSRYDDYLNWGSNQDTVDKALYVIKRDWRQEWVGKRIPSRTTVVRIWKEAGIQPRMKELPPLPQLLEENNLLETS